MSKLIQGLVGDTVFFQEPEDGGYRPYPDGTPLKVLSFGVIFHGRTNNHGLPPGGYINTAWRFVEDAKGNQKCINTCYLKPSETALEVRLERQDLKCEELPETKFWEQDIVATAVGEHLTIRRINYTNVGAGEVEGELIYECDDENGWSRTPCGKDLTLVERGNVWKRAHGEEMVFANIWEEAQFYIDVGEYEEVREPKSEKYRWTNEEAMDAISDGIGHLVKSSAGVLTFGDHIRVVTMKDEELGERFRQALIAEHNLEDRMSAGAPAP